MTISVDSVAGREQLAGRSGLALPGVAHVDHGQQRGKASLPRTFSPRLSHYWGGSDE